MLKSYKYRIYPTDQQKTLIDRTFGVCRFLYNLALETRITAWKSACINVSAYDLQKQVTELKKEYDWMREPSADAINTALNKMDLAYKSFFKGGGFPKFKRRVGPQSYTESHPTRNPIDFTNSKISVPKIHGIKTVFSRHFEGQVRSMTISRTSSGRYFVSVLVKTYEALPIKPKPKVAVGIDLGIQVFATLSTGEKIGNPRYLRSAIERLKVLQNRASKKKRGSKNRVKAFVKVAVLYEQIANQRKDFLHKVSSGLIRDNQTDTICLETLSVSNMIKNRRLSQAISDVSWSEFVRQLEYKGKWFGKNIILVDRFYASSKTCHACGHKVDSLPLSVREWVCRCGATHDRDVNAAINIRNSGMGNPGVSVEQSAMKGCVEAESSVNSCNCQLPDGEVENFHSSPLLTNPYSTIK
jgi:putative transposase